jgi:hypothetical protein
MVITMVPLFRREYCAQKAVATHFYHWFRRTLRDLFLISGDLRVMAFVVPAIVLISFLNLGRSRVAIARRTAGFRGFVLHATPLCITAEKLDTAAE